MKHSFNTTKCPDCGAEVDFGITWNFRPRPYLYSAMVKLVLAAHRQFGDCNKEGEKHSE